MAMPMRIGLWGPRAANRCFSTTSRCSNDAVLDLLRGSTVLASQSNNAAAQRAKGRKQGLVAKMANAALPSPKQIDQSNERAAYQKQIYRKWQPGDVYAPHDLSGVEQYKWKTGRRKPQSDAFDTLGINPINEYKNFTMLSEYMTEMGRIKHSKETGLRPKNQRKIAKAIRRAVGLGLMPSVHRHPLVLKKSSPARFM